MKRSKSFNLIDAGYWLAGLVIGGIILAVWKKMDVAAAREPENEKPNRMTIGLFF
jgi:hypothetical protein